MSGGQAWDRSPARLRLVVVFVHASHSDGRGDLDSWSSGLSSREPMFVIGRSALCRLWSIALAMVLGGFRVSDSWVVTVGIRAMSSEIYNRLMAMAIPENSSSALLAPFVVVVQQDSSGSGRRVLVVALLRA
ncbi:hypothetical protein Taro_032039 [Colocasia esculenta]|uniref:Uncharacterized protein n=1 Tax=Colocasia esculenta TaxID=4460 RepID=A0A843VW81_COLES|nr:hypothetical protein [Colocasia esculenta]